MAPMISADNRLFDEVVKSESSRTVSEGNGNGIAERKHAIGQTRGGGLDPSKRQ